MKPITESAAKRRAMALGGKLELPTGKVFNASRSEVVVAARAAPKPDPVPSAPIPEPVQDKATEAITQFAAASFSLADSNSQLIQGLKAQLDAMAKPDSPARAWRFTINRDKTGEMTSIDAVAKE